MDAFLSVVGWVFLINTSAIGLMWLIQYQLRSTFKIPARHSLIDGTIQRFLYLGDFWTMSIGDLWGLPFVGAAAVSLAYDGHISISLLFIAIAVAIPGTMWFGFLCLQPNHKPDWGYPAPGKISACGIIHLIYLTFYVGAAVMTVWSTFSGQLRGLPMWLAWVGGLFYIGTFFADLLNGNFETCQPYRPHGKPPEGTRL